MDFFSHQDQARKQSRRLVVMFALAVAAVVVAIDLIVVGALEFSAKPHERMAPFFSRHGAAIVLTSFVVFGTIVIASLIKTARLRAGGSVVAVAMGGTLVPEGAKDLAYRRLRNVVEEIAIASGVPVPEIYVLEKEEGINAFAAGFTPADAAIAVTRGCLQKLNRDELQGVIAHEFSHVLNGDMRLNIRMMGVLFGLLVIGILGREVLLHGRGGGKDGAPLLAIALGVMIIGFIGLFFGRMIKATIARQREYLADASAVQFTRQTVGIAGALKKIAALPAGSKLETSETEEVSHMLFGEGTSAALFATHPSLDSRILRLDKSYKPTELAEIAKRWTKVTTALADDDSPSSKPGIGPGIPAIPGMPGGVVGAVVTAGVLMGGASSAPGAQARPPAPPTPAASAAAHAAEERAANAALPSRTAQVNVEPRRVSAQVGNPSSDDYTAAANLQTGLPDTLTELAYMRDRAPSLVLALALDADAVLRERQLAMIETELDSREAEYARDSYAQMQGLHPMQRLPLAALAFPSLRRHNRPYLQKLMATLGKLIHADGTVHLGEYCLARMMQVNVFDALDPSRTKPVGSLRLNEARESVSALFGVLAHAGHDDPDTARRAFLSGMHLVFGTSTPTYTPPREWQSALDAAWPELDRLNATGKQLLIEGITRTMSHDDRITLEESELLRTICATLHCPLPPMLAA